MNLSGMKRYGNDEIVDAVVVGTGAGGAPLLARLAHAGLRVVALEAGRNWTPSDHTPDEVAAAELYWLRERLSAGDTPQAFGANNSGVGVGGSTLHWGAFVPRADPRDLRLLSEQGVGADWPLTSDDLRPFYERVEAFIGVSGPASYPWDADRHYPLPPVPRNAPAEAMSAACAKLGIRASDAPAAVVSHDFVQPDAPVRQACVACGACHQGCRNGAKTSMDVTYLPMALVAGAEIRPSCFVHEIERDTSGRITAVVYREGGVDRRQLCGAVFLCAGAVETPRLLLHLDLGNSSGQVGRNYMAHVATQVWGSVRAGDAPQQGLSLIPHHRGFHDAASGAVDFAGGYLVQSLGMIPVTWAGQLARARGLWGQRLVDAIEGYNHVAGLGINGECLPQAGNRLELSDETDDTGLPKPRITFSYGPNERAISRHAVAFMTSLWETAGATDIWSVERAAHTIGTCRMGTDPETAVVDPVGKSFRRAQSLDLRQLVGVSKFARRKSGPHHHGAEPADRGGIPAAGAIVAIRLGHEPSRENAAKRRLRDARPTGSWSDPNR